MDWLKKNFISTLIALAFIISNFILSLFLVMGKEESYSLRQSIDSCAKKEYVEQRFEYLNNRCDSIKLNKK